jgi:chromatin remodeling complex protein RSC6
VEATPDVTPMGNTVEGAENVFGPRFAALLDRLTSLTADLREVSVQVRSLQKEHTRFVRENTKKNAKRQRVTKRNASGFAKPTLLSDEMYAFLGIDKGTMVVRNDVTRRINAYVVEHKLRNETDKRRIVPNDALKALTNVSDADTLTYFNIQKYIKHHFVKPTVAAPVA